MNKNSKVPMAILSCFLIAFIIQGILKLCGVFIFEKAISWDIFRIIDNNIVLNVIYQILINIIAVYCLSFALTTKCYSRKWYHYIIILFSSVIITTIRTLILTPMYLEYLFDIILYIVIPIIINISSNKNYKLFEKLGLTNIITLISIQILLYFSYLGLTYWSSLLSSFIITSQVTLYSSAYFLIFLEVYIGLFLIMLSLNIFISKQKGEESMIRPQNISSDLAKKKAKKQKIDAKILKLNDKSNQLAKEIAELENE